MNRLGQEKSPYLLQHKDNPVDWYPWGEAAFAKAKAENKPIFLSIGYSTCHWCHVMEHESFENAEIARLMNEHFVNIKVDREERPDVDQIYMTAVQLMTNSGGWPLSVFLDHQLKPFFGGTYFPPDNRYGRAGFSDVLRHLAKLWKEKPEAITETTGRMVTALREAGEHPAAQRELSDATLKRFLEIMQREFDPSHGGFGPAPKFPRPETLSLLLHIARRGKNAEARRMVEQTFTAMARGGIYDHLWGGFARYSVDARWLIPHFEKMLYDNAQLASVGLQLYQVTGNPFYAAVVRETLDTILRDMTAPEGGFYSAQDADSEGEEGKFIVWTADELRSLLEAEEYAAVAETYGVTSQGNFEHGTTNLALTSGKDWGAKFSGPLKSAFAKMSAVRKKRVPPGTDDKVLVSWNGLMIAAMAQAGVLLGDPRYLAAAQRAADFLLTKLWDGTELKRRWRDGEARYAASLDDYSFLIHGLIELYQADFDPRWFAAARALQARQDELFWSETDGGYFFTDGRDPHLLNRTQEIYDGAVPSGNSMAAHNLVRLHAFTLEAGYREKADRLFQRFSGLVAENPHVSPFLLIALDFWLDDAKEVALVGRPGDPGYEALLAVLRQGFNPNKVVAAATPETLFAAAAAVPLLKGKDPKNDRAAAYLCSGHACQAPAQDPSVLQKTLAAAKPLR